MTEKHVADRWQVSLKTLRCWRLDGEGPVWHKLFRHVRHHEADVLEFEHSSAQHLMTLLVIKRDFKPEVPEAAQGLDAKAEDNYYTAKEIAEAASLPIHLFRDQAERNRKRVPRLMLVGNLRFSLPAILEWEMANSVVGSREQRERNGEKCVGNVDFRRGVLKRQGPETAPTQGERAKKSQPDKGWDFTLWWWNTEPNPRLSSEQVYVRKSPVPNLDHLAVFADIRQSHGIAGWWCSMRGTGGQSPSGLGGVDRGVI